MLVSGTVKTCLKDRAVLGVLCLILAAHLDLLVSPFAKNSFGFLLISLL